MIRSTSHSIKFANASKQKALASFISRYQTMTEKYINILWNSHPNHTHSMLDNEICKQIATPAECDSRIRQCAAKQACSIVNSRKITRRKQEYVLKKLQSEGKDTAYLQRAMDIKPSITKPILKKFNVELDSRFVDIQESKGHFDVFIQIDEIGNQEKIRIPIKHSKLSRQWLSKGTLKTSIRLNKNNIVLYFEVPEPIKKNEGTVVGADQGQVTVLSLSDGQVTKPNKHGHDLNSILRIIARKKKGSKAFGRSVQHRKNYINWSLNQLNWENVKEVKFEKIVQIRKSKQSSRLSSHWTYPLIKEKVVRLSEEKGFRFTEQDNRFRSQRCSHCGWVHKSNRKGKTFKCGNAVCGFTTDSDLNAAVNHEIELPEVPQAVWQNKINRVSGFFWNMDGVYFGQDSIVPDTQQVNIV